MDAPNSQGKRQTKDYPSLPDDIFFRILILLPADFLHHYARYVCKAWASIISDPIFIKQQLNPSKSGLVIQTPDLPHNAISLNLGQREFGIAPMNTNFSGQLISTIKGISLFHVVLSQGNLNVQIPEKENLYVGNLVTRKFKILPCPIALKERFLGCHITFVPQSCLYKVLCCVRSFRVRIWRVYTLGVNQSWRKLDIPSTQVNREYKLDKTSVSVGGVIYLSRAKGAISAFDLNLETNYSVNIPNEFVDKRYWICEMGDSLSCGVNYKGEVHIYMLKDLGEWVKVHTIIEIVDKKRFIFRSLVPVGWLKNGEIFVFIIRNPGYWMDRHVVAYDVATGESMIHRDSHAGKVHIHTNSLVRW